MIQWRPYQTEIIENVFSDWQKFNSLLVVGATGMGKTQVLWGVADRFIVENPGARVMVLAHRQELISQPKERLEKFWPQRAAQCGIVMGNTNECHRQIVIATVQTVGHKNGKRIAEVLQYGKIDLLIVDECHHCASASYQQVIAALKAANPALKHLGVTATPERGDKKSLNETYQHESSNVGVIRLIDEGFLCQPKVHGVKTSIDLSWVSVHGSGGNRDYNNQQLVAAVETSDCFKLVVKTHVEKVGPRPTIAFVPSVAGAYRLAEMLRVEGVAAIAADGTTDKDERETILADFKQGRHTCLINVALWTEGLDLPSLECCHLVRPTKSDALYMQMVGRVLRTHPGKELAEIFDYQPLGDRNLEMRMEMLGIKKKKMVGKFAQRGEGAMPEGPTLHRAGDQIEYIMLDYFKKRKEAWITAGEGWRIVGLGKGGDNIERSMAVSPDGTQLWAIWRKEGERWNQAKCYLTGDFDTVAQKADEFARKYGSNMVKAKAPWRKRPPTDKMIQFGQKLKVYQSHMTAGQLSDAINQKLVMQAIQRSQDTRIAA
jgi:superfamily II DNA or RNA helicase